MKRPETIFSWPQPNEAPLQTVTLPVLERKGVSLHIKRDDLLHPLVSGNKWRKLKYNILEASKTGHHTLLTFGGAYSNHIHATAAAGKLAGMRTIGIIRGEAHWPLNHTLSFATSCGMELHYLDRSTYRLKHLPHVLARLKEQFGEFYHIPEGGTNTLAVKGCAEMVTSIGTDFDFVATACGTGGTLAGIVAGLKGNKNILGFPALKGGDYLEEDVVALVKAFCGQNYQNWKLITDYHFGGYAKTTSALWSFMESFTSHTGIPLDSVYTGKMLFGLMDLIAKDYFPEGTRIVAIHTGGLQGDVEKKARPQHKRCDLADIWKNL